MKVLDQLGSGDADRAGKPLAGGRRALHVLAPLKYVRPSLHVVDRGVEVGVLGLSGAAIPTRRGCSPPSNGGSGAPRAGGRPPRVRRVHRSLVAVSNAVASSTRNPPSTPVCIGQFVLTLGGDHRVSPSRRSSPSSPARVRLAVSSVTIKEKSDFVVDQLCGVMPEAGLKGERQARRHRGVVVGLLRHLASWDLFHYDIEALALTCLAWSSTSGSVHRLRNHDRACTS